MQEQETRPGIADAVSRIQAIQDEARKTVDEYDRRRVAAGGFLDLESDEIEEEWHALGQIEALDRALNVLQSLAHGIEPAQGSEEELGPNERRTRRGRQAIELHPDFRSGGLDVETAASDVIADILHAVFTTFTGCDSPEDMLDRALRTYEGDAEDEDDAA